MITKTKYKKIKTYSRKDKEKIKFLLKLLESSSSLTAPILNDE